MAQPPTRIRALREQQQFELEWPGTGTIRLPFVRVRAECPCASCIDEITGAKLLDPATIPPDVAPRQMSFVGNYALKIVWSDGHATGLYTWDVLAQLAQVFGSREPPA